VNTPAAASLRPVGEACLPEAVVGLAWIGSSLACTCADGSVHVDGRPDLRRPPGPGVVVAVACGPAWEMATIDHRGDVRVGQAAQRLGGWGRRVWWSDPGRLVAVTSAGVHGGRPGELAPIRCDVGHVVDACLLPGSRVALGTADGLVIVDHENGTVDAERRTSMACAFALSADGQRLAVGEAGGSVHVVDLVSGLGTGVDGYGTPVRRLTWAGEHLVVCDLDEVNSWPVTADGNVAVDAPVRLLAHDGPIAALASRGGNVVAAGDAAGRLLLLAADREERALAQAELPAGVASLAWSTSGWHLAVGCLDGTLRRFDLSLG
jgi:WD40 repeat protein